MFYYDATMMFVYYNTRLQARVLQNCIASKRLMQFKTSWH